jgi:hypothetical protein
MSAPDDSTFRILDWVLSAFGGLIMLFLGLVKSKADDDNRKVESRISEHTDVFTRLFAKMDDMSKGSENRHIELLNLLHQELNKKADK